MKKRLLLTLFPISMVLASCGSIVGPQPGPVGRPISVTDAISVINDIISYQSAPGYTKPVAASFEIGTSIFGLANNITYTASSTGSGVFNNDLNAVSYTQEGTIKYDFKGVTSTYNSTCDSYLFSDGTLFYDAAHNYVEGKGEFKQYLTSPAATGWIDCQTAMNFPTASSARSILNTIKSQEEGSSAKTIKDYTICSSGVGSLFLAYTANDIKMAIQFIGNEIAYYVTNEKVLTSLTAIYTCSITYLDDTDVEIPHIDSTWEKIGG